MRFLRLHLTYRNIQRLRSIVGVFIRHGFYPLMERLHLHRLISLPQRVMGKRVSGELETISLPVRARLAFEELGPTFIKLGQILSTRPDMIPEEFVKEFLKLQDEVPPFPFDDVEKVIKEELKRPIDQLFKVFEEMPVAAASIAQVHRAITLEGDEVVVKVQRPGIKELLETDTSIFNYLARLIIKHIPESRLYDPSGMVEEFQRVVSKEMDFTLEASFTERFRKNLSNIPGVVIPAVYWGLTTRRVITLQRVGGIKVDNIEGLKCEGIDTTRVASIIVEAFFKQVFDFGLFHGDLHSGNIFVLGPEEVAFVDFGIVGRVTPEMRDNLADIFIGLIEEDYDRLMKVYTRMGIIGEDVDMPAFMGEYQDFLLHYFGRPWKMVRLGEFFMEYIRLASRFKIRLPREFLLLDKCIFELEGLIRLLHPDLDIFREGHRFAIELMKREWSPTVFVRESIDTINKYRELIKALPHQMDQILKKMIGDKFTIDFMHKGLEDLIGEMDRSSNRITFGLIVSALIVGSSLIIAFGRGPTIFGLPLLGVAGFTVAGFLGIWLAFLILRSGKF